MAKYGASILAQQSTFLRERHILIQVDLMLKIEFPGMGNYF